MGAQSDPFEDLAMPLFDRSITFAHWLTQNHEEAEDLVQETYVKASERVLVVPVGDELPGVDVPNPAQHVPNIAYGIAGDHDRIP